MFNKQKYNAMQEQSQWDDICVTPNGLSQRRQRDDDGRCKCTSRATHKWEALPTETKGSTGRWNAIKASDFANGKVKMRGEKESR